MITLFCGLSSGAQRGVYVSNGETDDESKRGFVRGGSHVPETSKTPQTLLFKEVSEKSLLLNLTRTMTTDDASLSLMLARLMTHDTSTVPRSNSQDTLS